MKREGFSREEAIEKLGGESKFWKPWDKVRNIQLGEFPLYPEADRPRESFSIGRARAGGYETQIWDGSPKIDIDHKTPLAQHWTDEGHNSDQQSRITATVDRGNLQAINASDNRSKGAGGATFTPVVGPNFADPRATRDAKDPVGRFDGKRWKAIK